MFKKIQFIAIVFSIIVFSQCNKIEVIPDEQGIPVFFVPLMIAGADSLDFTAGLDDYALFTSYEQAADGVYTFIGEFKKEGDPMGNLESLRFEIRDREIFSGQIDITQALSQPSYLFFKNIEEELDSIIEASFSVLPLSANCSQNLAPESFIWDFGDGLDSSGFTVTHDYENIEERTVRLTLNYDNNLQATSEQKIKFDGSSTCSGIVETELVQNNTFLSVNAIPTGGVAPFAYAWEGDSIEPFPSMSLPLPLDSMNNSYSVTITDSQGCETVIGGDIPMDDPTSVCSPSFDYSAEIRIDIIPSSEPQFSTITIIYTDEGGHEYRSDIEAQSTSFFTIQNIEDFANNENGEKTKKIAIDFSCELYSDESLPSINVSSVDAIIGIAYPE